MKLEKKAFLFFCMLLFTSLSICSQSKEALSIVSKTIDKKDKNCTYKIQYPILKLGKDAKYDVNPIKAIGKVFVDDFTKLEGYENEFECNKKDKDAPPFSLTGSYEVKLKNDSILSIYSSFSGYTEGNSYPNNVYKAYNYNLLTGKEISFESLFKKDTKFLKALHKYMTESLLKDNIISEKEEFLAIKKDKFEFYLSLEGIHLINLYDVHAMQSVEIKVPYIKMKKYLDINTLPFVK